MRETLKHLAEGLLVRSGVARAAGFRQRTRTLILAYHNIVPEGESPAGDKSLHLSQRAFATQLDVLAKSHEVIPIDAVFDNHPGNRQRVVITFDDAYSGCLTAGVAELVKRQMPATIFVAPALAGGVTWWDALASPDTGVIPDPVRATALDTMRGDTALVLGEARRDAQITSTAALPRIGTLAELEAVAAHAGITFGSHTWSHPNLCELSEGEIRQEIARPLEWLRGRFSNVVRWLSYPYGLFNESARRIAAESDYVGAVRIDGGRVPRAPDLDAFAVPRFNIPSGLSLDGFRLRLAGL